MLTWSIAAFAFVTAATYAIGGRDMLRQLIRRTREVRSQAAAALQPPTQAEMQRVVTDTARPSAPALTGTPVSVGVVAVWIGGILVAVVALFYLTGRAPRKRRD